MNQNFLTLLIYALTLYFVLVNITYAVLAILSWFNILKFSAKRKETPKGEAPSVSFIVPAYNEQELIVETVQAYSHIKNVKKEIIIINDGSSDQTFRLLQVMFQLRRIHPEDDYFVSITNPDLKVLHAPRMGKAQALNYGISRSKFDLICTMDADSVPVEQGIEKCIEAFQYDKHLVAAGGVIKVIETHSWLNRFQRIEYLRAFISERIGWSFINSTLLISGAYCMMKKEALLAVGGFRKESITEDFDLIVRRRRLKTGNREHFLTLPVTTCFTQAPEKIKHLRSQRKRWQHGLIDTLHSNSGMVLNPGHGLLGLIAIPYFWLVEVFSPFVELFAIIVLSLAIYHGLVPIHAALLWIAGSIIFNILLALFAADLDESHVSKDEKYGVLKFAWHAFLIHFGYRQLISWWRLQASLTYFRKKQQWGVKIRQELTH